MTAMLRKDCVDIMKIFSLKNRKQAAKCFCYVAAAYFMASFGVNGVINPMYYLRNVSEQTQELKFWEDEGRLAIELPQERVLKGQAFLSYQIEELEDFISVLPVYVCTEEGNDLKINMKSKKGWNWYNLSSILQDGKRIKALVLPRESVEIQGLQLKSVELSPYPKVDTARMLSLWMSFLMLVAFWECVWWMKERYAE